jgi:hypothetical protein
MAGLWVYLLAFLMVYTESEGSAPDKQVQYFIL